MMKNMVLAMCLAWSGLEDSRAQSSRESPGVERFNAYIHEMETGETGSGATLFSSQVATEYEMLLKTESDRLQTLVDETEDGLRLLFRASQVAVFYTGNAAYLDLMERALNELERRHLASPGLHAQMYEAYVRTRRLDDAHALATRAGLRDVSPIPPITRASTLDMDRPAWFRPEANGEGLLLDNPTIDPEFQVIVTTGAYCNPSHRALREIHRDKALAGLLGRHALWVMPADSAIHGAVLRQLTTDYPGFRFGIAYGKRNWPMVDNWATPIFHVFKDGRLVDQVVGWPEGGRTEALRKALSRAGAASDL